jgi:hypothetical protein
MQVWSPPVVGREQVGAWWACRAEAWQSINLVGLSCKDLVEWISGKPCRTGPCGPVGWVPRRVEILQACGVGAWWSGDLVGL